LNVAAVLLLIFVGGALAAMNYDLAAKVALALVALMGLVQLTYLVPIGLRLRARGQPHTLQGVIIGAALTFLLTAACAGPVLSSLFAD
jgi:hypothetical protein